MPGCAVPLRDPAPVPAARTAPVPGGWFKGFGSPMPELFHSETISAKHLPDLALGQLISIPLAGHLFVVEVLVEALLELLLSPRQQHETTIIKKNIR